MIFGIIFLGILYSIILICHFIAPQIDFNQFPISEFGRTANTALIFNVGMIITGVVALMYARKFIPILAFGKKLQYLLYVVFTLPCLGMILVGLFPLNINPEVHNFGWRLMSVGLSSAMVVLGVVSWRKYRSFAVLSIGLALIGYVGLRILDQVIKGFAIVELYFLAIISIWIVISYFQFREIAKK